MADSKAVAAAAAAAADVKVAAPAGGDVKDAKAGGGAAVDPEKKNTIVVVTGATGFIASHLVQQLLAAGYSVRGTATSLKADKLAHLTKLPGAAERLTMHIANLNDAGSFDQIVAGAHYVCHTASPYTMDVKDPKKDLLDPAVNGTLTVLTSCTKTNTVKRIVLTSSVAAITDSPDPTHTYTEADWNQLSTLTRNPYYYSKKMAEEAAWKFAGEHQLNLVVINPFLVLGPSLSAAENPSVEIIKNLLTKKFPAILDLWWGIVDVRDVARAHVLGFENAAAKGRHLCCAGAIKMVDMCDKLRTIAPEYKDRLPTMSLDCSGGTVMAKLGSYFEKGQVGDYIRTNIARQIKIDHSKIIGKDLGLVFTDMEVTIRDTVTDLIHWGHLDWIAPIKMSDAELDACAQQLKASVPISDHKHGLFGHTHVQSFLGSEAVDSIMKINKIVSRSKAVKIGEALLAAKKFYAKHDAAFADNKDAHFSFLPPK